MITFSTERWDEIKAEIGPLWKAHHAEIADPQDVSRIPLDPDIEEYEASANRGILHITTGRKSGILVAYAFVFVKRGLHYKSTLFGHWDLYWVDPEYRGHFVGVRLFKATEQALKARGVKKMTNTRKIWRDTGPIFRWLGWRDTEIQSTKWIAD